MLPNSCGLTLDCLIMTSNWWSWSGRRPEPPSAPFGRCPGC